MIGADHPELEDFVPPERMGEVNAWRNKFPPTAAEPDFSIGMELGSYAIHPLTGARLPVWAAPYVLGGYGTGAIMAVPGHDARDWAFARAHSLPIVEVISGGNVDEGPYSGAGTLVNSGEFNGATSDDGKRRIVERLSELRRGQPSVQYKLRDWLISRQRYWGPPIPIIHCPKDGPVAVPEEDLPVLLPDVEDFRPRGTGLSPLATVEEWVNVPCPKCGEPARRETDVSDTFLDSAWYHLRYPSTDFDDVPFDKERTDTWLPVNMYIGGNEHAVRHLLYARFVMRALHDMGLVPGRGAVHPVPRARHDHHGRREDVEEPGQRAQPGRVHRALRRGHGASLHDVSRSVHARRRLPRQGHRRDDPLHQPDVARYPARHRRRRQRRGQGAPAPPPHQAGRGRHRRAALQHGDRVPHGVRARSRPRVLGTGPRGASMPRPC